MDLNKFTQKSQEALGQAQDLATSLGHQQIDCEHLSHALINQESGFIGSILKKLDLDPTLIAGEIKKFLERQPKVIGSYNSSGV